MRTEYEVQFYIDLDDFKEKLAQVGAQLISSERVMRRWIFALPGKQDQWIRVRDEGDKVTLSCKSFDGTDSIESVKELEVQVDNFDAMVQMLEIMGLSKVRYVQNVRETFKVDSCFIMIDQWPGLEPFIEIEGEFQQEVERVAEFLGFDMKDGMYGPTAKLYEQRYGLSRKQFDQIKELKVETIDEVLASYKK